MLRLERQQQIIEILEKRRAVTVGYLAKQLYISPSTVRRDLSELEQAGIIKRSHGGAMILDYRRKDIPIIIREQEGAPQKQLIAQKALKLVKDGDVVMLDSSSTVLPLARLLCERENITVITNNLKAVMILYEAGVKTYVTGGVIDPSAFALTGRSTLETLDRLQADILFFSSRGLDPYAGVTDFSEDETMVRQKMIERSKKRYLLLDHTKLYKTYMLRVCAPSQLDGVICDQMLDSNITQSIKKQSAENNQHS